MDTKTLEKLAKLIRYHILTSTTAAGSNHPTSSLSATDLMSVLFFGGFFRFDLDHPDFPNNDRLIFSKGHASALFYSLYAAAGKVSEAEMMTLRKFGSRLEGHPTLAFPYTEAATGSLGQGLSVGVGMALNGKYLDKLDYKTYVLLGDSETAEGSVWEAAQIAAHYKLDNLVGILDVNRLGQSTATMLGHDVSIYQKRFESFGWETILVDGHNTEEIIGAFEKVSRRTVEENSNLKSQISNKSQEPNSKPKMIIARTIKGKGVSFLEDKEGWHGKTLTEEQLIKALEELGEIEKSIIGDIAKPTAMKILNPLPTGDLAKRDNYQIGDMVATRKAYGNGLVNLFEQYPNTVVLDGETSNSTYSEIFRKAHTDKYFEMFIAEQNMVGTALGLSKRGKLPFVSTFSVFFTRAFDQIRMANYSGGHIIFCGSHAGVSIGEDGVSQMGLEDMAMFRSILNSAVMYPSDAVSTEKVMQILAGYNGISYLRITRKETPVIYNANEQFKLGGSKVLRSSGNDSVTVVAAGITLHEALTSYNELKQEGIDIRVIDLYSIKPIDAGTLVKAASETKAIITVEDHYHEGGLGEAVKSVISAQHTGNSKQCPVHSLAVGKMPRSGKPDELLAFEEINSTAIVKKVKELLR